MAKKTKRPDFATALRGKIFHLQNRFQENLVRVDHLIALHKKLNGKKVSLNSADGDVLRSAVVFLHAALEDFLRGVSIVYLPTSSETALDKIPLLGLDVQRSHKFGLGALFAHRHRKVGKLIEASVAAHLKRNNYSSIAQLDALLIDCDKAKWPKVSRHYPALGKLMQRRHQIVHRGDCVERHPNGTKSTTPISLVDVQAWVKAVKAFEKTVTVGIIDSEYTAAFADGYIAYLRALRKKPLENEIDRILADVADQVIDTDESASAMASTNASGFHVDDYRVTGIDVDAEAKSCRVSFDWHASGDSDPDKSYFGDEITGTADLLIDDDRETELENVTATVPRDDEWSDSDAPFEV